MFESMGDFDIAKLKNLCNIKNVFRIIFYVFEMFDCFSSSKTWKSKAFIMRTASICFIQIARKHQFMRMEDSSLPREMIAL